jgi:hypothetical protein
MWFVDNDFKPLPASQDIEYAFALLRGIGVVTHKDREKTPRERIKKIEFPSATTKPTEKEARAALARVLTADGPPEVLIAREHLLHDLAVLFDPYGDRGTVRRRVVFRNASQGHGDVDREMEIGTLVRIRKDELGSYNKAVSEVAELSGISERQVQKIYQKTRGKIWKPVGEDILLKVATRIIRNMSSDRRSEDTAPDS